VIDERAGYRVVGTINEDEQKKLEEHLLFRDVLIMQNELLEGHLQFLYPQGIVSTRGRRGYAQRLTAGSGTTIGFFSVAAGFAKRPSP